MVIYIFCNTYGLGVQACAMKQRKEVERVNLVELFSRMSNTVSAEMSAGTTNMY